MSHGGTRTQRTHKNPIVAFAPVFDSEDFKTACNDFLTHRREKRNPVKATSYAQLSIKLLAMGEADAVLALHTSIEGGWTGVFPPKSDRDDKPRYDAIGKPLNESARRIVAAKAGRSPL